MIKLVELFSGIGSQAKAAKEVCKQRKFDLQVLNTCEWDIHAIVAYDYIHNGAGISPNVLNLTRDELIFELSKFNLSNDGKDEMSKRTLSTLNLDILRRTLSSIYKTNNLVDIKHLKGEQLPNDITIMTYSFPCQDLSNVGALHGYNKGIDRDANTRSGLLWQVERILYERYKQNLSLPQFLLLENVTSLEAERHKHNFEDWQNSLTKLGYINRVYKLYAPDFGVPQNRRRLLMVSVFVGNDQIAKKKVENYFYSHNLENEEYRKTLNIKQKSLKQILKLDYTNEKYFEEAKQAQPNDTKSRRDIWNDNCKIIDEKGNISKMTATITTKQDRHPNSGNIYFDYNNNAKSKYRFLTPRECFLLMGFSDRDYDSLVQNNFESRKGSYFFSRDKLYKLAGNTIVVDMLKPLFNQMLDIKEILENK